MPVKPICGPGISKTLFNVVNAQQAFSENPNLNPKKMKPCLYAITEESSRKVKIGTVGKPDTIRTPKDRLNELQQGNPCKLSIVREIYYPTYPKAKADEDMVHAVLEKKGLKISRSWAKRGSGEWFKPQALRLLDEILRKHESSKAP